MNNLRKIKIYGERNTGTRYLTKLIEFNLDVDILSGNAPKAVRLFSGNNEFVRDLYFRATYRKNLGWKHAMAPTQEQLEALDASGVLFITLTKNPYAWLLSMSQRPYHGKQVVDSFTTFLETEWPTVGRENHSQPFLNPIVMWNEKNCSYLDLNHGACVRNLRYEDLLCDPASVIGEIADSYSLARKHASFVNVTKSTKQEPDKQFDSYRSYYLEEQWRSKLDPSALALINAYLDGPLMNKLHYEPIE